MKPYGSRKTNTKSYDVVIIGGGIAGMYAAYKLHKKHPKWSIKMIEKNAHIGGRIQIKDFHGLKINTGAGILRFRDERFKQLLRELKVKMNTFWTNSEYRAVDNTLPQIDLIKMMHIMHQNLSRIATAHDTVNTYLHKLFDQSTVDTFVAMSGYNDYLHEPALEFLQKRENLHELVLPWKAVQIDWYEFLHKMVHQNSIIAATDINTEVQNIQTIQLDDFEKSTYFLITAKRMSRAKQITYSCQRLILATTVNNLLPFFKNQPSIRALFETIRGQPFFRVYGKVVCDNPPLTNKMVVTPTLLKKIIPIQRDIYMIAYNDNDTATQLHEMSKRCRNKRERLQMYETLLRKVFPEKQLKLIDIDETFWDLGTHYFLPIKMSRAQFLSKVQNPSPNMYVIGEMVSTTHGWVEGALESVDNVLPLIKN